MRASDDLCAHLVCFNGVFRSDANECPWAVTALKPRLLCSSPLDHTTHERLLKWKRGSIDSGHSLF